MCLSEEVIMHVIKRFGFIGLGMALVVALSGLSVFAGDKMPIEDGSKIVILSPKDGDKVGGSFELKYELTKGSKAAHAHVYLDGKYQQGFGGTFKDVPKGMHEVTVTGATKDHDLLTATQTIHVEVQ